jgi:hypothetical protein
MYRPSLASCSVGSAHFCHGVVGALGSIPELRELEDIDYLRQMLSLEMTDEQASAKFEQLIHECMRSKATRFNNVVHILAH